MKKYLEFIARAITDRLMLASDMPKFFSTNPLYKAKHPDWQERTRNAKALIGETYLILEEVKCHIWRLDRIKEYCLSEINGTYKEDQFDKWADGNSQFDAAKDNAHNDILSMISEGDFALSEDLKTFIGSMAQVNLTLTKGLFSFFGEAMQIVASDGGSVPQAEVLQNDLQKDYAAQANILEGWDRHIGALKQLAEAKGSLAEIINLCV